MSIVTIMEQVKYLTPQERKILAIQLIEGLDIPESDKKHNILEFAGMAEHLADDEDPQDHVTRIRQEWANRP